MPWFVGLAGGGPGSGRVAKGWDASATPNGTIVLVHLATSSWGAKDGIQILAAGQCLYLPAHSTCRVSLVIVRGVDFISFGVPSHANMRRVVLIWSDANVLWPDHLYCKIAIEG